MTNPPRYELPSITSMQAAVQGRRPGKTVQELEDLEQRTYEEAFAKGHAEGRAQGLAAAEREMRPQIEQLQARVQHVDEFVLVLRLHDNDIRDATQVRDIEQAVMRRSIVWRQAGPIHAECHG